MTNIDIMMSIVLFKSLCICILSDSDSYFLISGRDSKFKQKGEINWLLQLCSPGRSWSFAAAQSMGSTSSNRSYILQPSNPRRKTSKVPATVLDGVGGSMEVRAGGGRYFIGHIPTWGQSP